MGQSRLDGVSFAEQSNYDISLHRARIMIVRRATTDDLDRIVDFICEEGREAEERNLERDTVERGVGAALRDESIARYWVLTDEEGSVCGCTSVVTEWSDWNAGYYWWIQSMFIAPEHRGQGHVSRLMDTVVQQAREHGCLDLRLYVHDQNKQAVRAYEKYGFHSSPYAIMSKQI